MKALPYVTAFFRIPDFTVRDVLVSVPASVCALP